MTSFKMMTTADPWISIDGRLNAPIGTPQFAGLLNGYPTASPPNTRLYWPATGTQPPWHVAGVDYAVGPRPNVKLKDPFQGLTPSNANLDPALVAIGGSSAVGEATTGGQLITFSGSSAVNQTISGWDFSGLSGAGYGGCGILINANGMTVTDCYFKVGLTQMTPFISSNGGLITTSLTVKYCTIDGAKRWHSPAGVILNVSLGAGGSSLIQYCWFRNTFWQYLNYGMQSSPGTSQTLQYCVFENAGYGAPVVAFNGYISGTTLTVTSTTGVIPIDHAIWDSGGTIIDGTSLLSQLTGTAGSTGTYQVGPESQTIGSAGSPLSFTTGESYNTGGHGDWNLYDTNAGGYDWGNIVCDWNTFIQNEAGSRAATQGSSFGGQAGNTGIADAFSWSHNTFLVPTGSNCDYPIIIDTSLLKNNAVAIVQQNYGDPNGTVAGWRNISNGGQGTWNGSASITGNVNMVDGTALT